ncbi:MAG: hypothetical protein JRI66_10735 [Deltaproteobacteria bacterium]|nr:hypothetical protein [Deltaproteobacteria bacterium]
MKKVTSDNGFEGMVAIQLCIRFWPGQVKLKAEDLGLDPNEVPEVFYLGHKKLYPKDWRDRFNNMSNKARNYLNDNSYPFVLEWVRAIPKHKLAKMMERLEEFRAEYMALAEEFLAEYDKIRAEWKTMCDKKWPGLWAKLAPYYPGREYLKRRFDFYWNVFDIRAAEATPASAPEIIEAYERARAQLQARYDEMVEEAVLYLRKRVLETVQNLSTRLKEGRIVRNDTLDSVRRVESWFRDLNIFGDMQVEEALAKLRAALNGTDSKDLKDNEPLKKELANLADQVAAAAGKLDDVSVISGNYKRMVDLS